MGWCGSLPVDYSPRKCERLGTAGCAPPALPGPSGPPQVRRQKQAGSGGLGPVPTSIPSASALTSRGKKPAPEQANTLALGDNRSLPNTPQRGCNARVLASPTLRPKRVF